jgi:hypothetical protein
MSQADAEESSICEFCGLPITEDGQECAALADGRCQE